MSYKWFNAIFKGGIHQTISKGNIIFFKMIIDWWRCLSLKLSSIQLLLVSDYVDFGTSITMAPKEKKRIHLIYKCLSQHSWNTQGLFTKTIDKEGPYKHEKYKKVKLQDIQWSRIKVWLTRKGCCEAVDFEVTFEQREGAVLRER